jgi:4-amino-4-deoxy-L-arabinose transferase-like glycosyltransferase
MNLQRLKSPYLILFVIAFGLRLVAALWVRQPGFVDAYYYYQVAENWYNGRGLTESVVWNYQVTNFRPTQTPLSLEHPAFAYWMPLSTFLTAGGFVLFGQASFWAGVLPFMLLASVLPPLAYWLGQLAFGRQQRRYSWLMALLTLFPGRYFLFWNAPDNFTPFALISLLCLIATWAGLYKDDRWLPAAGALGGLAYLSRSDGILLLVALVISFLIRLRQKPEALEKSPRWLLLCGGLLAGLLVVLPWLIRNSLTFGTPLSPDSSKALYLRDYTDLFSYALPLGPSYYFNWGFNNVLASKLNAAWVNLLILSVQGLFLAAPLFLIGIISIRKNRLFLPFLVYIVVLYLAMTLIFTAISGHGTLFHSGGGLLPFQAGAVLVGLETLVKKLWRKPRPDIVKLLAGIVVGLAIVLTLFFAAGSGAGWDADYNSAVQSDRWLRANNLAEGVIIVGEPLSYYYATGHPVIGQASDSVAANVLAAQRYGAKYLLLEQQHYDALNSLYLIKQAAGLQLVAEFEGKQLYRIEAVP